MICVFYTLRCGGALQDGIKLFTYSFYKQRRADVQAFFAQIYSEAQVCLYHLQLLLYSGCIIFAYTPICLPACRIGCSQ